MLRRPKVGDTESDLLALQERFLVSGEKPSVSLAAESVGGKRKQRPDERDVVQLGDLPPAVGKGVPTTKRSKFKQKQDHNAPPREDPHGAMDVQDTHFIKMLSDIQERDIVDSPIPMPTRITTRGFPIVHELDVGNIAGELPLTASSTARPLKHSPRPKKSLFAHHYDQHSPEFFGIKPTDISPPVERDKVQPLIHQSEDTFVRPHPPPSHDTRHKATPTEGAQFASTSSEAWAGVLACPPLISGDGLMRAGVSVAVARQEVEKIHLENVERLASVTQEELIAERRRVEEVLGGDLVAFLKRRSEQKEKMDEDYRGELGEGEGKGVMEKTVEGGGGGEVVMEGEMREATGTVAPDGWLHMDVVEKEKMEWTTDIFPENTDGGPVRFSLDGLVIPGGTIVPSHLALHHHGNEPAAAGYTLQELLGLVRSAVPQQRVLSLTTLAKIMGNAWWGRYRDLVSHGVLPVLCDAGLPLLLRYAVDDSSMAVMAAALSALHSLLVPQCEEALLEKMCDCRLGSSVPCVGSSQPAVRREGERGRREEGSEEDSGEEDDVDIIEKDVVQGYLVTGLPRRLRYILEVVRPGPAEVLHCLELLTRITRHSLQAATEVVHCPRLMDTVFREFLPLMWATQKGEDGKGAYGVPQPVAVRLVQVICSVSRNLSFLLLSHHKLLEVIVRYTVPHPSELSLPPDHAHSLSTAALQTGRMLLHYGLATDWLRDCYPVLSRHFYSLPSLSLTSLPLHEATYLASLIWLLEPAVCLTPSSLPPSLTSSLLTPLLSTLPHWMEEAEMGEGEKVLERLACVRAVLNVLASHLTAQATSLSCPLDVIETAATLSSPSGLLVTLSHSSLLLTTLHGLQETSPLCHMSPHTLSSPPHPSLPSLHSTAPNTNPAIYGAGSNNDYHGHLTTPLISMSSADFLLGFLRLCLAVSSAHKGVVSKVSGLLEASEFKHYVQCVCNARPVKYSCVVLGEFQLLYTTVKLFMMKVAGGGVGDADCLLYHQLALHLLSLLPPGMEYAVDDLISTVVFHPSMFPELCGHPGSLLGQEMSSLSMHHPPQSLSADHTPPSSVLGSMFDHLPSILSTLLSATRRTVYSQQRLDCSRYLFLSAADSSPLPSLCLPVYSSPLLPADWFSLPLVALYQHSLTSTLCGPGSEVILTVKNTLHVQLLLEQLRPSSLAHLPPSVRLARTLTTFLIGNDLFLEGEVRPSLSALLTTFSSETFQLTIDFHLPIPGLPSFQEFYDSLLTQFSAVSYGDPLFSCYMLLPLQRRFPVCLRHSVWEHHSHTLRLLSLPLDQLPVKLDSFLVPPETDHQLLDLYMGALVTDSVRPQWSPVFYLTALHHVHHFLFHDAQPAATASVMPLRKRFLLAVQQMNNKDTQTHILYYSSPTSDGTGLGFKVNSALTDTQRNVLTWAGVSKPV